MRNKKAHFITQASMIAAIYVVLTIFSNAFGLANGPIQIRISEALTILPVFTPMAIPGIWIGCLVSNLLTGAVIWDVIFGSLATLLGAVGTWLLRKHRWLAPLPPIVANTVIVPLILSYAYGSQDAIPLLMITVGIGEVINCYALGMVLWSALARVKHVLFRTAYK